MKTNYKKIDKFVKCLKNEFGIQAEDYIIANLIKNRQLTEFLMNKINKLRWKINKYIKGWTSKLKK